jgi:CHASE2 domain-containing sensor protein
MKSGLSEPLTDRQSGFIVPAGILIGLGAGLLVDHAGAGFLVGLGLGLLGSELVPLARKSREGAYPQAVGANVTLLLIGAVLVLAGISIVWAPAAVWIYAIPGLMILAGIGVLVRGFLKTS